MSRAETEDAVQEARLRVSLACSAEVADLGGRLTTVVARVASTIPRPASGWPSCCPTGSTCRLDDIAPIVDRSPAADRQPAGWATPFVHGAREPQRPRRPRAVRSAATPHERPPAGAGR